MALSESARTLRLITIWTWIPAVMLLIPHGVTTHLPVLPLGIIPMSVSAVFGIASINAKHQRKYVDALMDLLLVSSLLAVIIPGLIILDHHRGAFGGIATCPLLVNCVIHAVLLTSPFWSWLQHLMIGSKTCPHCNRDIRARSTPSNNGRGYVPVMTEHTDGDVYADASEVSNPRPSTDDETARLV